jgi:hypothetical protein
LAAAACRFTDASALATSGASNNEDLSTTAELPTTPGGGETVTAPDPETPLAWRIESDDSDERVPRRGAGDPTLSWVDGLPEVRSDGPAEIEVSERSVVGFVGESRERWRDCGVTSRVAVRVSSAVDELVEPVPFDPAEPVLSANATAGIEARAAPIPNATASAPIRPT